MPLKVHFLNVGRGDCTIIEFPSGRIGMVDIENLKILDPDTERELLQEYHESAEFTIRRLLDPLRADSEFIKGISEQLTDPLAYYDTHIGRDKDIFRMIVTHPDMDHMTGLYRLHEQDPGKNIVNFWHTGFHDFNLANTTDREWASCPYDQRDWETYKKLRASTGNNPTSLQKYQGQSGDFWTEDGLEVWAPTPTLEKLALEKEQPNIISYVLKISYKGWSIILGGDGTAEETWPVIAPHIDVNRKVVLKASHHGRRSGYYGPAIKALAPWLTITSVGEKAHDATENYRRYSDYTVSLRKAGDIRITISDSGQLIYSPNAAAHWKAKKPS